jgi:hypothetical protein
VTTSIQSGSGVFTSSSRAIHAASTTVRTALMASADGGRNDPDAVESDLRRIRTVRVGLMNDADAVIDDPDGVIDDQHRGGDRSWASSTTSRSARGSFMSPR